MEKAITRTMGCDVGDKYSHVCLLGDDGRVVERARLRTSRAAFQKWFGGRPPCVVAVEVGTHSRWIDQDLTTLGHQVIVANARQVRLIYGGHSKNDQLDAEALARLARVDPRLLKPVQHRGPQAHGDLLLLRSREQLVKARTELINHVRGVAKSMGSRIPKCESSWFSRRARAALCPELCAVLEPLLESIEHLSKQIVSIEKKIESMLKADVGAQVIATINGVGALTAMAFVLTLEDPSRFARSRDVAAFLGLVPKQRQSGDRNPELRISKAGDGFVRRLLVQCAQHILGPFGRDSDLRRFGQRLMERGAKNAKKRAVVAVARKLSVLMHRMWVTGEIYQPLRNPSAAAA